METRLDILRALPGASERKADAPSSGLEKVAKEFENVFTRMMLKAMRDTVPESEFNSGNGNALYQEMLDGEYSKALSRGKGLGIADMLVRQFGGTPAVAKTSFVLPARIERAVERTFEGATDFVKKLWPMVKARASANGIAPEGVIAQAALETGWGKHVPRMPDGRSSHNLFGIKATHWQGERVARETLEFENGVAVKKREWFRAYPSAEAAVDDYLKLLDAPRYANVRAATSITEFANALQQAGYATDPEYAAKVCNVANGATLRDALAALKNGG